MIYPAPKPVPSGGKRAPKELKNRVRTMRRLKCVHCGGVQTVGDRLCETCGGTGERIVDVWRKRPLKQRKRIKARNAKRKGRAFGATRVDEAYLTWIRGMRCAICAALGCKQEHPTEAEHFVDKSHGGFDRGDTFPTCGAHRILRHEQWGKKAFERRMREHFKLDLRALCDRLARTYETERWPCP